MIFISEYWPAFATEFTEFKSLWTSYQDGKMVYQSRSSNIQGDFLVRQTSGDFLVRQTSGGVKFILRLLLVIKYKLLAEWIMKLMQNKD